MPPTRPDPELPKDPPRPAPRQVGGLTCFEVLDRLSAYFDGEVLAEEKAAIEAHVRGCSWCEKFGGEFVSAVGALRRTLAEDEPLEELEEAVRLRLRQRLDEVL